LTHSMATALSSATLLGSMDIDARRAWPLPRRRRRPRRVAPDLRARQRYRLRGVSR
jgi:hypothetical protein